MRRIVDLLSGACRASHGRPRDRDRDRPGVVDVAHWLVHDPADTVDDWLAHCGVGDPAIHRGGLTEPKPRTPIREVTLVQRKTTRIGIGLGKTSGWAHRAVLKQSGARQVSGATYERVEDAGLHLTVDGSPVLVE